MGPEGKWFMAASGNPKICPRCNAILPATAAFCGDCGLRLAGSPEAAPRAAPTPPGDAPAQERRSGPASAPNDATSHDGAPEVAPPVYQPGYNPPAPPGYVPPPPSAPPGYVSYPVPPAAALPRKGGAGKWIAALLALVVLAGCVAAWLLYLSPSHTNSPFFDRHGLQSNVPLPGNTSFVLQKSMARTDPTTNTTVHADSWVWTTSAKDPTSLQQFYQEQLPRQGWGHVHPFTGGNGEQDVTACQGNQALIVGIGKKLEMTDKNGRVTRTIVAPSGGAAISTELSSSPQLVHLFCSID